MKKTELLRLKRNAFLRQSDYTQLPDVDLTPAKKAEWVAYRQALRDITDGVTEATADKVIFPVPPSA